MNTTLEQRKLSIVAYLAELQDEGIIRQIENLLKPNTDFWDELSEVEKESIERGLSYLKQGHRKEYNTFLQEYFQKKI